MDETQPNLAKTGHRKKPRRKQDKGFNAGYDAGLREARNYFERKLTLGAILDSREWRQIRRTIIKALERYPQARYAVSDALLELEAPVYRQ